MSLAPPGGGETGPMKSSEVARRPVTKIIQGDWIWENAGFDPNKNPPWHSYKSQRRYTMLFGDSHVEFYRFPLNIAVDAPVSVTNAYCERRTLATCQADGSRCRITPFLRLRPRDRRAEFPAPSRL